jgi:hypothetical protein
MARESDLSRVKTTWIRAALIALICEKIIQHIVVTIAFYRNWADIQSTVVVSPDVLMVLGAAVAMAFALGLWGMLTGRNWATGLIIALAMFDIIGEFVAQGRISITITVSFIVAIILLVLAASYRGRQPKGGA